MDLIAEWEEAVRRMMRVTAILLDESEGNHKAIIVWNGRNNEVRIGDVINNRRITGITQSSVTFTEAGRRGEMPLQAVPPRPANIDGRQRSDSQFSW